MLELTSLTELDLSSVEDVSNLDLSGLINLKHLNIMSAKKLSGLILSPNLEQLGILNALENELKQIRLSSSNSHLHFVACSAISSSVAIFNQIVSTERNHIVNK